MYKKTNRLFHIYLGLVFCKDNANRMQSIKLA